VRRERNLFPQVVEPANLARAFHDAGRGKRDRREVLRFEHDLEGRLLAIRRELEAGLYRWGEYRRFRIRDPKPREIRAPVFRDRVVHHALFNVLDPLIRRGLIADTYACIPGRGTHRAVARFRAFVRARDGRGWVLKCDVRRYFASVDHEVLKGRLARVVGDRRLLALLHGLVDHGAERPGKGMPIGNLTSQMFANLYLDALDHFVKEELRVRHYLRYMDDFLVVVDDRDEARRLLGQIESYVDTELRLALNPRRVTISSLDHPQDVLGTSITPTVAVRVRRKRAAPVAPARPRSRASGRPHRVRRRAVVAGELARPRSPRRRLPALPRRVRGS
jgi:retron-type reverse transcriptase